jgi:hypothetical protein
MPGIFGSRHAWRGNGEITPQRGAEGARRLMGAGPTQGLREAEQG